VDRAAVAAFPRRSDLRVQGATLGVCLALVFVSNIATPGLLDRAGQIKGTDFSNFYVLGSLVTTGHHAALYDRAALRQRAVQLLPESSGTYYLPIYGPQIALLFAPLALLPYGLALFVWLLIITVLYAVSVWAVWRTTSALKDERWLVLILAAAYPAFFYLLAHGQNSAVALACVTAAYLALRARRPWLAGVAIGTLVFKPQLGLVAACVFLLNRQWAVVTGAILAAGAQLAATWLYFSTEVMRAYVEWLRGVGDVVPLLHIKPDQMHSLLTFWQLIVPWDMAAFALYLISSAVVIAATSWLWRVDAPLSLKYSLFLVATVLVSPHLYVYDLVILAPVFLLVADWSVSNLEHPFSEPMRQASYFAFVLPLMGVLTQHTRVQLSVVAMAILAGLLTCVLAGGVRRRAIRAPDWHPAQ
jgi:hypothetical protein